MRINLLILIALLIGCGEETSEDVSGTKEGAFEWAPASEVATTCDLWVQIRNAAEDELGLGEGLETAEGLKACERPVEEELDSDGELEGDLDEDGSTTEDGLIVDDSEEIEADETVERTDTMGSEELALAADTKQSDKDYLDVIENFVVQGEQDVSRFQQLNDLLEGSLIRKWKKLREVKEWDDALDESYDPISRNMLLALSQSFVGAMSQYKAFAHKYLFLKEEGDLRPNYSNKMIHRLWFVGVKFEKLFPEGSGASAVERKYNGVQLGRLMAGIIDFIYFWRIDHYLDASFTFGADIFTGFFPWKKVEQLLFDEESLLASFTPKCGEETVLSSDGRENPGCLIRWSFAENALVKYFELKAIHLINQFPEFFPEGRFDSAAIDANPDSWDEMQLLLVDGFWNHSAHLTRAEIGTRIDNLKSSLSAVGYEVTGENLPYQDFSTTDHEVRVAYLLHKKIYHAELDELEKFDDEDIFQSMVYSIADMKGEAAVSVEESLYTLLEDSLDLELKNIDGSLMTKKDIALLILHDFALALGGGSEEGSIVFNVRPSLDVNINVDLDTAEALKVMMYGFSNRVEGLSYEEAVLKVNAIRTAYGKDGFESVFFTDSSGEPLPEEFWMNENEGIKGVTEPLAFAAPIHPRNVGSWGDGDRMSRNYRVICLDSENKLFISEELVKPRVSSEKYVEKCGDRSLWAPENQSQQLEMDRYILEELSSLEPNDQRVWIGVELVDGVWISL